MNFVSAGESHGSVLVAILSGFPAGLKFDSVLFEFELGRRRRGDGRSARLDLEDDAVQIVSGVVGSVTTGAPIAFLLKNRAGRQLFENGLTDSGFPRPGHVDFGSFRKFDYDAVTLGAERSSARETAMRVAAGAFCKMLLAGFGIGFSSEIVEIGGIPYAQFDPQKALADSGNGSYGGVVRLKVSGVPVGLGSNSQWFTRIDSQLSSALVSIPSVKGVYFGDTALHKMRGREALDSFTDRFGTRSSNMCGGIEGGITTGSPIEATVYFKPIPSQPFEVASISPKTGEHGVCPTGMNDLWCIERAGVIVESAAAFVVANAFCDKFGYDCMSDIRSAYDAYIARISK
ncbi:chorismate synthase [bacterium]|nr:chorismate synthase [bacterium]